MTEFCFKERLDALRTTKMRHTQEKWDVIGSMDFDDHSIILPPEGHRKAVQVIGGPGIIINDILYTKYVPKSNHPSGGFFGTYLS